MTGNLNQLPFTYCPSNGRVRGGML